MPLTFITMFIGTYAITGLPFLSGFYSKDLILELSLVNNYYINVFSYILIVISTLLTSVYSFRLLYFVFFDIFKGFKYYLNNFHAEDFLTCCALILLTIGSLFSGYVFKDLFVGFGSYIWNNNFNLTSLNLNLLNSEFIEIYYKYIPFCLTVVGCLFSYFFYYKYMSNLFIFNLKIFFIIKIMNTNLFLQIFNFFIFKCYFDVIYNKFLIYIFLPFSFNIFYKLIDRYFLEFFGSVGLYKSISLLILNFFLKLQSGSVSVYIFLMCWFVFSFFIFFLGYYLFDINLIILFINIIIFIIINIFFN